MPDTVIILGAGASVDAGIPTLSDFMDTIQEIKDRRSFRGKSLNDSDKEIFENAWKAREYLNTFHGRSSFEDRNIEDILSLLSFPKKNSKRERNHFRNVTKAISRTIELCSNTTIKSLDKDSLTKCKSESHKTFWRALFSQFSDFGEAPTIITFNYDLILERSLHNAITVANGIEKNFDSYSIDYGFGSERILYDANPTPIKTIGTKSTKTIYPSKVYKRHNPNPENNFNAEIFKLHGSLSFGHPNPDFS